MSTACTVKPPYFVVVWGSRRLDDMKRVWQELEHAVRKHGQVVYVGIMTRATEPATEEFRARLGAFGAARTKLCSDVYLVFEGESAEAIVERATVQTILRESQLKPVVTRSVADLLRVVPRTKRDALRVALAAANVRET